MPEHIPCLENFQTSWAQLPHHMKLALSIRVPLIMTSNFVCFRLFPFLVANLGLACCGGTTSSPVRVESSPYEIAEERLSALLGAQDELRVNPANSATVLGNARYNGVILFSSDQTADDNRVALLSGDLELVIDLSRTENSLAGSITNLNDAVAGPISGALTVNDGSIDTGAKVSDGYSFSASLTGALTLNDGDKAVGNGGLEGDFLGGDRDQIRGTSYLQLVLEGSTARFVGQFAASD